MSIFSEVKLHSVNGVVHRRFGAVAFLSCKVATELGAIKLNSIMLKQGPQGLTLHYPKRSAKKGEKVEGFDDYFYFEIGPKEELEAIATELWAGTDHPEYQPPQAQFPQLIKYKDKDEFVVVDSWAEVDRARPFELA